MEQTTVLLLIGASAVVALIGVVIDRINFPQRRFRPKAVDIGRKSGASRDRTGAHIIDVDDDDQPADPNQPF